MSAYDWFAIATVLVCVLLSAAFAGSETALIASSRAPMLQLERQGDRRAGIVNRLLEARERLISALLIGNNAVNIVASSLATGVLIASFGDSGVLYSSLAMTVVIVVFAEVLPKTAAFNDPDRVALVVARPIAWTVRLLGPVLTAVEALVGWLLRRFGLQADGPAILSAREELRGAACCREPKPKGSRVTLRPSACRPICRPWPASCRMPIA